MEKTNLNKKAWYRALKVVFVLAFILAQATGMFFAHTIASEEKLSIEEIAKKYGGVEVNSPTLLEQAKAELARRQGVSDLSAFDALKVKEELARRQENPPQNSAPEIKYKYNQIQKTGIYALSFVIILFIFWLIARVFFYIFLGEKFLAVRIKKHNKN